MTGADFDAWLDAQASASAAGIAACVSRTDLVKDRPGFGQRIVPAPGSVLATPVVAARPTEPDYFFHWVRDGALIVDALPHLVRAGDRNADWHRLFREFVAFNLALGRLDGRNVSVDPGRAQPDFVQFLRPREELDKIHGAAVAGDVRVNADGTLDTIRWSRPQHDGPALRALACLRAAEAGLTADGLDELIEADLDYTRVHAGAECVDLWEETGARDCAACDRLAALLAGFWSDEAAAIRCTLPPEPRKQLDMAVILGVLHAGLAGGPHSVEDFRVATTLSRLERQFAADYPLNAGQAGGIVCGRYPGDRYVTGGPWYLCSFAAAEFRYRRAARVGGDEAEGLIAAADALMRRLRATIPPSGALSEQFDPATGAQASARDLGWSHAAFLTALAARRVRSREPGAGAATSGR
jgi:glucoamylase